MSTNSVDSLWDLLAAPTIDPRDLCRRIESALEEPDLDWRTLQLIQEGWDLLERVVGLDVLDEHLTSWRSAEIRAAIDERTAQDAQHHQERRFPSLEGRLTPHLSPETLKQYLRELGGRVARPLTLVMRGSSSLILRGLISRSTEDLDLVDEIPSDIRGEHQLLHDLVSRYGLRLAHFQSHYLPDGWSTRTTDFGTFGKIHLRLVDPIDIAAGKLYSSRTKDLDDLRMLARSLDAQQLRERAVTGLPTRWTDDDARKKAIENWYIVYGATLEV